MTAPTVSIIIPTYNRATLLPRAVDSVIAQTFVDWEIVVVDDGSTDATALVAARYRSELGERFVYLRQSNRGSSGARNHGIDACRGRFLAFLDSDDEFLPNKLERQLELFARRPELGFVYSDYTYVDLDGVAHKSAFDDKCRLARAVPFEEIAPGLRVCIGNLFDILIRHYFIATIVGMVRREVLGREIRFPIDQDYAEEWLFYLNVARVCRSGFVNEPLCVHHFVAGSLARTDKHRNAVRYRDLLTAIEAGFVDLNHEQRRAIDRNRARASRQIAYDARRAGRHREAALSLIDSLRRQPSVKAFGELLQVVAACLVSTAGKDHGANRSSAQAPFPVVR